MAKGKKGTKKSADDGLPEGFAEAAAGMSTDEIRRKMSDVMLLDMAMRDLMEGDDKYQQAKIVFEQLAAPYKEDFKSFKLQIKCLKRILDDKNGGAISAKLEEEHVAAKEARRTAGLRESTRVEGAIDKLMESGDVKSISVSIGSIGSDFSAKLAKALKNPAPGTHLVSTKFSGEPKVDIDNQ
jgi:hypothetical protein